MTLLASVQSTADAAPLHFSTVLLMAGVGLLFLASLLLLLFLVRLFTSHVETPPVRSNVVPLVRRNGVRVIPQKRGESA